jgi:microcystin-dependent protein
MAELANQDADGLVGGIVWWGSAVLPSQKWMWPEGQVLKRQTYSLLFSRYGTAFNTGGEAGDEFRLPNMPGRMPVYQGADAAFDTVGETGGTTVSGSDSHNHNPITGIPGGAFYSSLTTASIQQGTGASVTVVTGGATSQPTVGSLATSANVGGGTNMPPFITLRAVIKVL